MEWTMVATVVAAAVVVFPAAFVTYLNVGGILQAVRAEKRATVNAAKEA